MNENPELIHIRDSLWYFLLIFGCDMACALVWLKGPDSLLQAVVGFGLVIPSVAGSHLLMNLRDAYYHPTGETTIGRSDYSRHDIGELPLFNRGKDILDSGQRYRVKGNLDISWALDSAQVGEIRSKHSKVILYKLIDVCRSPNLSRQPNRQFPQPARALHPPSRKHERFKTICLPQSR